MIGQTFGPYRIEAKLGAGGMGVVYRAQDMRLERPVALKLIGERLAGDETARALLLREARSASTLNHPNICTIYEVGEAEGQAYIAMELVEGRPLSALLPAEGLGLETALRYGTQIADALAHAHERGIVHRDLKTANVVVTPEGRAKVLDFGLAKRLQDADLAEATRSTAALSEVGRVAGTLHYMAPELLRGEPADARSDIWALGVVLHEMASGRLPFEGKTGYELSSAILNRPPGPLPTRVPAVLRSIIVRCLGKEPGQRYQRAGEVRAALEVIETAELFPGRPSSPAAPMAPPRDARHLSTGATPSSNPEANEYFEKALLYLAGIYEFDRAQQMLERALEIDPHFAEARAWYGFAKLLMIIDGLSNDTRWLYEAEEEVRRALADDAGCGRAHSVLAGIYLFAGRKELIPGEVEKALRDNPQDADARLWLSHYYIVNGDTTTGEAILGPALEVAPTFWPARLAVAYVRVARCDLDGAIRAYEKILEQDARNGYALQGLAHAYLVTGDLRQARTTLERIRPTGSSGQYDYRTRVHWALLFALEGKRAEAEKELDPEVLKFATVLFWCCSWLAECYAVLGQAEKALEWLDLAVRNGDERLEWFQYDPLLASIRNEPRLNQILKSIAFRRQQRQAAAR
ncbi:MAG TPA: protein kinase [Candidatus Xenobia bacterium]|nr:protein kinase [Candidatus Xenobia bacterium]